MNKAIENRRASAQLANVNAGVGVGATQQRNVVLSNSVAPLWRNAPTSADYSRLHYHPQPPPKPATLSSNVAHSEAMAFHRSLRQYPPPPGFKPPVENSQIHARKPPVTAPFHSSNVRPSPSLDSLQGGVKERCHVTSLEAAEQTNTPFYLNYLDSATVGPKSKEFDHRTFMEMFRPPPSSATPIDSSQQQSSMPYSVNEFQDSLRSTRQTPHSSNTKVPGTALRHSTSFSHSLRTSKMSADGNKPVMAFGSRRARNMDLSAPLMTFSSNRPMSEIITTNVNFSALDSGALPLRAQSNYAGSSGRDDYSGSFAGGGSHHRHSIAEVIGGPTYQHFQPRVTRRHDPELMPAQMKYTFREYAAPSAYRQSQPSSMTTSQSNFLMTSSSAGVSLQRSITGPQRTMPKKSISMSRLDQLAQPRRRIVARPAAPPTPTESAQLAQHHQRFEPSARSTNQVRSAMLRKKPDVPVRRPITAAMTTSVSAGTTAPRKSDVVPKRPTTVATSTSHQKPRPKSQIEPLESLATSTIKESPAKPLVEASSANPAKHQETKPSDDYKKLMAERRAAFQKQKQEEERKRQEEDRLRQEQEEEDARQLLEKQKLQEQEDQLKAFQEAELRRVEAEAVAATEEQQNSAPVEELVQLDAESELSSVEEPKQLVSDDSFANVAMTQSFDMSMLSSERAKSDQLAKEKLEELEKHQAALLKQEELERQKRKNRVAELLKGRTRKNGEASSTTPAGGESPSGSAPSTPAQKTETEVEEAAAAVAEQSQTSEGHLPGLVQKLNGIAFGDEHHNGQTEQNGTSQNGDDEHHTSNGVHQQDVMKQFAVESEQSLPPTNGF